MNKLELLYETINFVNNKNIEFTDKKVIIIIVSILIIPYLFLTVCTYIINFIKNIKYKKMIFENPKVTKSIKIFAKICQEQFKKSMSIYSEYFKKNIIILNSKNMNKEKINIVLGEFNYNLYPNDLHRVIAPIIYDEMDEYERDDRFGDYIDKKEAIEIITYSSTYFECDYGDFINGGKIAVENIIKEKYPELIEAIATINKAIEEINNFIFTKTNTKEIYIIVGNSSKLSLEDLLENHFSDVIKISLVIKYQDYSKIELPEE